ncbi:MAG: hypothetical protein EON96_08040 [Caulobacteraceae bacterium]|nr:MAG: hypothetical protein EON96_08040 [Caulobacteraceae bacterium]
MSEDAEPVEFYGVLGRIDPRPGGLDLRFYPYAFSIEPEARVVLVVRFADPGFGDTEIAGLIEQEVEVTVFPNRAEVHSVFGGTTDILTATAVTSEWSGYDAQDLFRRVLHLEQEHARLSRSLGRLMAKDLQGKALVEELRRLDFRPAASDDLKARQAAAIAVLERLATHFESKE